MTGVKHLRSVEENDEEGELSVEAPVNRLSADFRKSTRQPPAKTASTASHRRVRSMPEVDLRMFDMFIPAETDDGQSSASYDAMVPALGRFVDQQ